MEEEEEKEENVVTSFVEGACAPALRAFGSSLSTRLQVSRRRKSSRRDASRPSSRDRTRSLSAPLISSVAIRPPFHVTWRVCETCLCCQNIVTDSYTRRYTRDSSMKTS